MANLTKNEMDNNSSNHSSHFLVGVFLGGVVGAVTALLLTPKSGKEFRSNMNQQVSALKIKSDHLKEAASLRKSELTTAAKEKAVPLSSSVLEQSTEDIETKLAETLKAFEETEKSLK